MPHRFRGNVLPCAMLTALTIMPVAALAQTLPAANADDRPDTAASRQAPSDDAETLETIIVTGTKTSRIGFETPLSVSTVDQDRLLALSVSSPADILATLPGLKAEGGGGEAAVNLQVRGLPSSGQYQFTPLLFDGVPVFSTFGLNSSAYDTYVRTDLGIERLEFVQGGVSNLFGPGSVAGVINYVSRTGTSQRESTLQLELAEEGRVRADFFTSGPLAEQTYYAVSGFYREDDGPLDSGIPTKGLQLRANLVHDFVDAAGSIKLYGQYIDDRVQFFLPIPLEASRLERARGNDGETVYTLNTRAASGLTSVLPGNRVYRSPIEDGVATKGGSLAVVFDRKLGNGFRLNANARYADYDHQFNLFLDGDGIINTPETQAQFLANRSLGTPAGAQFTYVGSNTVLPAGGRLFANRLLNRDRPAEDLSSEVNLTRDFQFGDALHTVTLGGFYSDTEASDVSLTQTYLAEFSNAPRLVDLTANGLSQTRNGLLRPAAGYTNNVHAAQRLAGYLADQINADRWAVDFGVRVERIEAELRRERTAPFSGIAQGGSNEAATLRSGVFGDGQFFAGEVDTTEWAASLGALYRLSDDLNVYGNFSRGFFFPEVRGVAFNAQGRPASYEGEIIRQAELGLKYDRGGFFATAALFWSELENRRSVQFVNLPGGSIGEVVTEVSTDARGVELTWRYELNDYFTVDGNVTYTDHEITKSQANPALVGNELERKPNLFANMGLTFRRNEFNAGLFWNHQGEAFANLGNTVVLPAYNLVSFDASYTFSLVGGSSARVGLNVFNVFDSQGLAEGSPRQGNNQIAAGQFFVGRPILPRRFMLRLTYSF